VRCAINTRKSTEHNLDLEFNSLDAQREACEAYIKSQAHEGLRRPSSAESRWRLHGCVAPSRLTETTRQHTSGSPVPSRISAD
jgi:hypothetical protein